MEYFSDNELDGRNKNKKRQLTHTAFHPGSKVGNISQTKMYDD